MKKRAKRNWGKEAKRDAARGFEPLVEYILELYWSEEKIQYLCSYIEYVLDRKPRTVFRQAIVRKHKGLGYPQWYLERSADEFTMQYDEGLRLYSLYERLKTR